jgi:hypothetical protein
MTLKTKTLQTYMNNCHQHIVQETIKLWDSNRKENFIEHFDILKVVEIENKLDGIISEGNIDQSAVDDIITNINCLFSNCSKESFGIIQKRTNKTKPKFKQEWFNRSCTNMRNLYHKTRRAYNRYKTNNLKSALKEISKQYKNTLTITRNRYNSLKAEKLRHLKTKDPKQYWKIINNNKSTTPPSATLDDLYTFFKNINEDEPISDEHSDFANNENNDINEEIDSPISEKEITDAIKSLKNNKSPGFDNIVNEQIKATAHIMLPIYIKLFNMLFDNGIIPESWTIGTIKPIYKCKGDPKLPENYRPICLLSCFGKLFTSIINTRLNAYSERTGLIKNTQAGFRKHHSTTDNLFILKSLIDIVNSNKKKLICCFVDFKQCFDSIWRKGLWHKLNAENINGKCFKLIFNMYNSIKTNVKTSEGTSQFFNSLRGVRQGENLSPFLFSIYLNDLEIYLRNRNVNGVQREMLIDDLHIYLKLFILLYADDTVIFSENENDMQHALNCFKVYCETWKLTINIDKTKIVTFSKGNPRKRDYFIGDDVVENVNEYKYLGIIFSKSGSFLKTKKYIAEQANKALYSLIRKIKVLSLPSDLQIELFEKTVKPVLLYGSEIWGFGNLDDIEKVQLKFYKYVFNLKRSTPSYMVYGELGITPISLDINSRILSFWSNLVEYQNGNMQSKLSAQVYSLLHGMHSEKKVKSFWLDNIKHVLCSLGYSGVWYSQSFLNRKWLIASIKQKLKDTFVQNWYSEISRTSDSNLYKMFKTNFHRSKYVDVLPTDLCKSLLAFLTRNHRLPIEVGRWRSIPANERLCIHCNTLGDEFHYLFLCPLFDQERKKLIKPYFYRRPNIIKLKELITSENIIELKKLSIFVRKIMKIICA